VEWLPKLVGFVLWALQVLAVLFLAYGAYLAIRRAGVRPALGEPCLGAADSEKRLALASPPALRRDRRLRHRRHGDRRARLSENLETASAKG
jgi:hypothetical protein